MARVLARFSAVAGYEGRGCIGDATTCHGLWVGSVTRELRFSREMRVALAGFFFCARFGGACRPGHERGARDDERERGESQDALTGAVAEALAEDDDAAGDRREVRRCGRGRDDRDAVADLQAARGRVERAYGGDQRSCRPRADDRARSGDDVLRERLDRDIRDGERDPGGGAEEDSGYPVWLS